MINDEIGSCEKRGDRDNMRVVKSESSRIFQILICDNIKDCTRTDKQDFKSITDNIYLLNVIDNLLITI